MHMARAFCHSAILTALASASPVKRSSYYSVKESHNVPISWSRVGPAPAGHLLSLRIGLKQAKFDDLERHLRQISDPSNDRYGQHLSAEQVNELVKPSNDAVDQVHDWLADCGISSHQLDYSPARDWISLSLPVNAVEKLLDTEYSLYSHDDGSNLVRTPKWSIPQHLHDHIDVIQPTTSFMRPNPKRRNLKVVNWDSTHTPYRDYRDFVDKKLVSRPTYSQSPPAQSSQDINSVCNAQGITPQCLRTLYGTINYTPQAAGENKVGVTDYLGDTNNRSDVQLFLQRFRPDAVDAAYTFPIEIINGGNNQQTPDNVTQLQAGKDQEGNLDAQYILGMSYPTPMTAWSTGGEPPFAPDAGTPTNLNEPYLDWVNYLLAQPSDKIPQTISTSYGDDEQTVPASYAHRVCHQFAQLGARGVSLVFASGDSGVGPNGKCVSNDGRNTTQFLPNFPATCPYVTAVGATSGFAPETAALDAKSGFTSGGGFSNYFSRPSYQQGAVGAYCSTLNTTSPDPKLYNAGGRAYPDISAQGVQYVSIWNGTALALDGTSAATPTAAGVIALVNDARIAAGRRPLGWLNPWLYSVGYRGFTDITIGNSTGCDGMGFRTATGWDPVTGWGTPDFTRLKDM